MSRLLIGTFTFWHCLLHVLLLFFAYSQKFSIDTPESFILLSFTTVKLLKEVKPAPGCKMMKLLTVDKFFQALDTRIRMTTGFAFSYLVTLVLAWVTYYWENIVPIVVLVWESTDFELSLFSSDLVREVYARERQSRETRETRAAAREEKEPLPSRAISHARGHLRVLGFARRTTKKTETARSLEN